MLGEIAAIGVLVAGFWYSGRRAAAARVPGSTAEWPAGGHRKTKRKGGNGLFPDRLLLCLDDHPLLLVSRADPR